VPLTLKGVSGEAIAGAQPAAQPGVAFLDGRAAAVVVRKLGTRREPERSSSSGPERES